MGSGLIRLKQALSRAYRRFLTVARIAANLVFGRVAVTAAIPSFLSAEGQEIKTFLALSISDR
jgi:hypothetical protein